MNEKEKLEWIDQKNNFKIWVNPEIANLFYTSEEDYERLKNDIKTNGQIYPIVVNTNGMVVDGHTRLKVCLELGIAPKYMIKEFKNTREVIEFIESANVQRREQLPFSKCETIYRIYLLMKPKNIERQRRNLKQFSETSQRNLGDDKTFTLEEICKRHKISINTFYKAQDIIESEFKNDYILQALRNGEYSIAEIHKLIQCLESIPEEFKDRALDLREYFIEEGSKVLPEIANIVKLSEEVYFRDFTKDVVQEKYLDILYTRDMNLRIFREIFEEAQERESLSGVKYEIKVFGDYWNSDELEANNFSSQYGAVCEGFNNETIWIFEVRKSDKNKFLKALLDCGIPRKRIKVRKKREKGFRMPRKRKEE